MSKNLPDDNMYSILGKLAALTPPETPASTPKTQIYESVEARGSITAGMSAVESNLMEKYQGFEKLERSLAAKGDVKDPGAVAASIGRKKYGKAKFQKAAAAGHKMGEQNLGPGTGGMEEGAKVDRMVSHVKSSEKSAGHSDKEAENIAWATANKRGYLDNKNKKSEGMAEGYDEFDDEEESNLHSGSYVRDREDPSGEVFVMRGDASERRVQIQDRNGSGWNISPSRLIAVDANDPAIARYFGEQGVAEGSHNNIMSAWNSGMADDEIVKQFGQSEFDRLTKKYGISSIPVPNLYGYIPKEPTDPVIRHHRGLDGKGATLKSQIAQINKQGLAEGWDKLTPQQQAHEFNLDAAQREMDRRHAQGEDMTGAKIDKKTYQIIKPKQRGVAEGEVEEARVRGVRGNPWSQRSALRAGQAQTKYRQAEKAREIASDPGENPRITRPTIAYYCQKAPNANGPWSYIKNRDGEYFRFTSRTAADRACETLRNKPHNAGKSFRVVTTTPPVAETVAPKTDDKFRAWVAAQKKNLRSNQ